MSEWSTLGLTKVLTMMFEQGILHVLFENQAFCVSSSESPFYVGEALF